jgi:hypothetical protein
VPELSDTVDINERISQARKLFGSMRKQLLGNKQIPIEFRRRLYQATVVNIALRGWESWTLKEADRAKLEAFHHGCLRKMCGWTMWDVAEKRITNERVYTYRYAYYCTGTALYCTTVPVCTALYCTGMLSQTLVQS